MEFVADLHLHSKYSRAVSQAMILSEMAKWGAKKGINLLTVSDWTHPLWFREIKNQLEEANEGIYKLKTQKSDVRFLLSTEIASIYKQNGKLRRIHNLLFAPSLEIAEKISTALRNRGCNLNADGRPIVGLSSHDLLEMALEIDRKVILIPCHAWTPHFGVYGSASGFDSIDECFSDLSRFVYGIETGISSDPLMNWQIKELENRSILSFSDAHSLPKMAREATVFEIDKTIEELNYMDIGRAIAGPMKKSNAKASGVQRLASSFVSYTIEFYPEEGKYHYTGHRNCHVSKSPDEIRKDGAICPSCKRRLTEGVMFRVEQLSDPNSKLKTQNSKLDENGVNWIEDPKKIHPKFVKLVPLNEIVAESIGSPVGSEKVKLKFDEMCSEFGSEIQILLKTSVSDIEKSFGPKIAEGVVKVRKGDIEIEPGFDGEYGKVAIWSPSASLRTSLGKDDKIKEASKTQLGLEF